jgi:DNA adenine methylase
MLGVLSDNYPKNEEFEYYIEPFIGSGWSFFNAVENLRYRVHTFILGDINPDFVWSYELLRGNTWKDISNALKTINEDYHSKSHEEKGEMYYSFREKYNSDSLTKLERVVALFFLNASGYNGLYRKNQKGGYNVSWCKRDKIYLNKDWETIHEVLNSVDIEFHIGSFLELNPLEYENAFWYFDPPYHNTHTSYSKEVFGEDKQIQLKEFCDQVHDMDSKFMLSNSNTEFIMNLYEGYNIQEFSTKRVIRAMLGNTDCTEVLVTNY